METYNFKVGDKFRDSKVSDAFCEVISIRKDAIEVKATRSNEIIGTALVDINMLVNNIEKGYLKKIN